MKQMTPAAVERAMKLQDVMLRAMAKRITWFQAAEILGISCRQMQRWHTRFEHEGYEGLFDRRRGVLRRSGCRWPRGRRCCVCTSSSILIQPAALPREAVRGARDQAELHLGEASLAGSWTGQAARKRGVHRKRRPRRPLPGMLLHIDGSQHQWFCDHRWYDLLVIMDDATSEIYYAQLVEQESTHTVMAGLREVIEQQGVFCGLYSDRASHFFLTPKADEPVDHNRLSQVGRALRQLGIQMIPAYSPQARGRSERGFGTWQGRLPQELRLRKITTVAAANRFLREEYVREFNRRFSVAASERGTAFVPLRRKELDLVFSLQHERVVARDNTVSFGNRIWQLERSKLRETLAGCRVTVHEHLDQTLSITFGPHLVGRYTADGQPAMEMTPPRKATKTVAPHLGLEKSGQKAA
ncbi:MAG TPA: ISNCY family transposase [Pyrinomonadaceae bacterium]|nr:ISNCY family transposase [Pyrinomonadaceae bacterium]